MAIGGYFFQNSGQNTVFWYFFEKITFKSLLLLRSQTILLENLYKGTSQGCKKLDRSAFLNFCFFAICSTSKFAKKAIFTGFCAINSAIMKNLKIRSGQVFLTIEGQLCAIFQVHAVNEE